MATRAFADEELERLREFPEIGRDEQFRHFTLTSADRTFVDPGQGRGAADRLGLAVTLCTLLTIMRPVLPATVDRAAYADVQAGGNRSGTGKVPVPVRLLLSAFLHRTQVSRYHGSHARATGLDGLWQPNHDRKEGSGCALARCRKNSRAPSAVGTLLSAWRPLFAVRSSN
ncbi:DUF4158 domain-containing protein [Kutzneria sp. 744]|uniref:DUF4158 domain-containing protein n=1 Tax=Kutzneria sp. (strain 744) TaxID=345341 RepID=UPI0003EEDEA4|nr:DUF4158 domain-containing protein [Kutzneria sp. 744]EWM09839.1 transposase [Kutzneria sp. 744]